MNPKLSNVHEDARPFVARDVLAVELAEALTGIFYVTAYRRERHFGAQYPVLFCKPTKTVAQALLIDREVAGIITNFSELHARTLQVVEEVIAQNRPRLDSEIAIVVHADRRGDDKLRQWGRERGISIIPIYRPRAGALPASVQLRQQLAGDLFSFDPFQVAGPVSSDVDFFGRKNDALELVRQLREGRIRALFGVRKIGKTSLINRVIAVARDSGTPKIAMVDCSVRKFHSLRAAEALRALAKVAKLAVHQGYAHISEALRISDKELIPAFQDLWQKGDRVPLAIILDEVDYITPDSVTAPQWRNEFNWFWREFRVLIQEAQRQGMPIALLISGVASRCFRIEQIGGVENAALHLIPEEYLGPFERGASEAMLREVGKRCGLLFDEHARKRIAEACADVPFWMRMGCSHIHRRIDISSRPIAVTEGMATPLIEEFVRGEGAEIAKVALQNLRRVYPEVFALLVKIGEGQTISASEGRGLVSYGLGRHREDRVEIDSAMIRAGLQEVMKAGRPTEGIAIAVEEAPRSLALTDSVWAEELAGVNRRRNLLERRMREFVRVAFRMAAAVGEVWTTRVLEALQGRRRAELSGLPGDVIMERLYWGELGVVIGRNWLVFERILGDKRRFEHAMQLLNDRPDAHAKEVDLADIALHRRELAWLEERFT